MTKTAVVTFRKSVRQAITFCAIIILASCSNNDDPIPVVVERQLISATFQDTKTAAEIQLLIQLSGRNLSPTIFKYDVNQYKVTYRTTYKDQSIEASGIVVLPVTKDPVSMLSFQHGTIVEYSDAPSALNENDPELYLLAALASTGFVTVVPDYIGFGESKEIFHPYYVEEPTADAVIDNIKAANELAKDNNVNFTNELFLAGYSQGGYATLAAHKAIEETPIEGIELMNSFPAAGGYDIDAMREYFFTRETYNQPFYMAYVGRAYQTYYGYSNLLTDFFNEPYASRVPAIINGINSQGFINSQLTTQISALLSESMRLNITTDPKYAYLLNAFGENSLTDWVPTKKIFFYHGDADATVPFENSVITLNKLKANGTPANLIEFITLPGADHATGVEPYFRDIILKLQTLK